MIDEDLLSAPVRITRDHELEGFACGSPGLDDWLVKRALPNEKSGASRTFVVRQGNRVVAYYALANGAVANRRAPGRVRRNMPDPIPVMVIGRLAVASALHGRGVGRALLRDALMRTLQASKIAGIRAILVHAVSGDAKRFYERCGFTAAPMDPMILMITVADAVNNLAED